MEAGVWNSFLEIIFRLGYPGILLAMLLEGVGIPFPGDVVMAFYGFFAANGHFQFLTVFLIASLGCWIGSWLAFFLGKRYGMTILYRFGRFALIKENYITHSQRLSERHATLILVIGRFLPGVRTVSSYIAGIGNMDWAEFLIYSLLGFFMWCFSWVGIGYWVGDHWQLIAQSINSFLLLIVCLLAVFVACYWLWKHFKGLN